MVIVEKEEDEIDLILILNKFNIFNIIYFKNLNINTMNYKNLAMHFILILSLIFLSSCKETDKTETGKENQTSKVDTTKPKVNTDEIVNRIQKFRTDMEAKLDKLTRKEVKITDTNASVDTRQKWEKMHGYFDGDKLVRIQTYPHNGISSRTEEFYFMDGKIVFVAINDKGMLTTEGKDVGTANKEFYFDNDKLIKYDNKTKEVENTEEAKKMYEAKLPFEAKEYMEIIKTAK